MEAVFNAETIWQAEWEDAPSKVLATHWPGVHNYRDVTQVDWQNAPPVDIITGGFPCQDVSLAGRRAGMTEGTRSNLWGAMRTAIETIQPKYVVAENVRGLLSAKAASDSDMEPGQGPMGDDGPPNLRAIGRVLADLSDIGYDAQWCGLRAADVGAPHGRFRVFILAERRDATTNTGGIRGDQAVERDGREPATDNRASIPDQPDRESVRAGSERGAAAHTDDQRGNGRGEWSSQDGRGQSAHGGDTTADAGSPAVWEHPGEPPQEEAGPGSRDGSVDHRGERPATDWGPYAPAIRRWEQLRGPAPAPTELTAKGKHRLSARFCEWMMGLPSGWVTDIDISRNEQLKALGNGVVPAQCIAALQNMLRSSHEDM